MTEPDDPAVLEVRGLAKRYGQVAALAGLDLCVRRGEVYGFLGRNGAGKSTTIRILMGITKPSAGEIRLFGESAKGSFVRLRQRIGYVAQEQHFYGWMSPRMLGRFVGGFYTTWDAAHFARMLSSMELPVERKVRTFSGGMKVKLALALALAHRPPLLILDEPTAGLDPVARREFLEMVRRDADRTERTTIFSTHLIDEIELVADRVGIVDRGRTRFEGDVRELAGRVRSVALPAEVPTASVQHALSQLGMTTLKSADLGEVRTMILEAAGSGAFAQLEQVFPSARITELPLEEIFIAMVRRTMSAE